MKGYIAHSIGRRKSSVARVYVKKGSGDIKVNSQSLKDYFGREALLMYIRQPLVASDRMEHYDIMIKVCGGGKSGQAGAVQLGIARAITEVEAELRPILKPEGFYTRDAREVERKKYGRHKARKRPQYSKR